MSHPTPARKNGLTGSTALALVACLGAFVFSGCEKHLTDANLRSVRADMSTKEVESVLGPPTRVEPSSEPVSGETGGLPISRYIYEQGERVVTLTFVGERLATGGISGSFEGTPENTQPANLSGPAEAPEP